MVFIFTPLQTTSSCSELLMINGRLRLLKYQLCKFKTQLAFICITPVVFSSMKCCYNFLKNINKLLRAKPFNTTLFEPNQYFIIDEDFTKGSNEVVSFFGCNYKFHSPQNLLLRIHKPVWRNNFLQLQCSTVQACHHLRQKLNF